MASMDRRGVPQKRGRPLPSQGFGGAAAAAAPRSAAAGRRGSHGPELLIDFKYANELPKPPVPKLLRALPSIERLCRYSPTSLEGEHGQFFLSEQDMLSRVELVDPEAYGPDPATCSMQPPLTKQDEKLLKDEDVSTEVKEAEAKRRRLHERSEASHRQAFGLQLPQLITNDIFTERQRFTTGLDSAEKKLTREPPGFTTVEELAAKIERTFDAAKQPPVHPSKRSMKPKRILDIVPDAVLWANRYRQIVFDDLPKKPARNDLLFRSAPTPRVTCFGFFTPGAEDDNGSYRLAENYYWENRGGYTRAADCGEGEAMLLSLPVGDEPVGEARFVPVPTYMRLKKQKAHRLDINLETKALSVTHRDASAQEAAEEQERLAVVHPEETAL